MDVSAKSCKFTKEVSFSREPSGELVAHVCGIRIRWRPSRMSLPPQLEVHRKNGLHLKVPYATGGSTGHGDDTCIFVSRAEYATEQLAEEQVTDIGITGGANATGPSVQLLVELLQA
mgnify:FL=1